MLLLQDVAQQNRYWMSGDGRIGERDLEQILNWSPGALKNKRGQGSAPPYYRVGGGGHQVTYRLIDVALWLEEQRIAASDSI
ncbi:MAG TPA: hypothetical protein VEY92_05695 [Pseudoxanthomonas sp.]|nr:hypothetical protein [Pseudoxanthomonas sp.]